MDKRRNATCENYNALVPTQLNTKYAVEVNPIAAAYGPAFKCDVVPHYLAKWEKAKTTKKIVLRMECTECKYR
uniref:Uncharacterized protein n=1 Tax=Glossina austeni TaxID=7395 RepID=A0A1A9VE85_GLOAU